MSDKVLTFFFLWLLCLSRVYILSDMWVTGRKYQITEKEMETFLAINLPLFSIY